MRHIAVEGVQQEQRFVAIAATDVNVLAEADTVPELRDYADWPTIPVVYIRGEFIGGCDITTEMYQAGELQAKLGDLVKSAA